MEEPMNDINLDEATTLHLGSLPADGLTVFTLENDTIRGVMASTTRMVAGMKALHGTGVLETLVLGKAYTAAALLSATIKGNDRIVLKVDGDGPAGGFSVECNADGDVRGRLFNTVFELDSAPTSLDTAPLVGKGSISITRLMEGRTDPVVGTAALHSGQLAEDLSWYFQMSEQTRSAFTLGVHLETDGRVAGAGGLFLQALPGASDESLDRVERLVLGLEPLGRAFAAGAARMDLCLRWFPFFDYNHLDDKPARFFCGCSREKLGAYIEIGRAHV